MRSILLCICLFVLYLPNAQDNPKEYIDSLRSALRDSIPFDSINQYIAQQTDSLTIGVAHMEKGYQLLEREQLQDAKDEFYLAAKFLSSVKNSNWDQNLRAYNNAIYLSDNIIEKLNFLQELINQNPKDQYFILNSYTSIISYLNNEITDYQKSQNLIDQAKLRFANTEWETNPKFVQLIALEFDNNRMSQNFSTKDELLTNWNRLNELGAEPTADLYLGMGNYMKEYGDYNQAIDLYQKGLSLTEPNTSQAQNFLQNIGKSYLENHDLEQAKPIINQSLKSASNPQELAEAQNNQAYLYLLNHQFDQAISEYKQSFETFTGGKINSTNQITYTSELSGDQQAQLYDYLEDIAQAYLEKAEQLGTNDYSTAVHYFQLADQAIDQKRTEQIQQESKFFWRKKVKPIYEHALLAAYKANNLDAFYQFHEKAKAVLLLNDFYTNKQEENITIRNQIAEIDLELVQVQKEQVANPTNQQKSKELALQEKKDSLLYQIKNTQTSTFIIPKDKLQKLVREKTMLISYIEGEEAYYGYIQKPNEVMTMFELPKSESNQLQFSTEIKADKTTLNKLYQALIPEEPLADNLIILPDGQLNFLPFESLVDREQNYLVTNHNLSYGFSASTYFFDQKSQSNQPVLIFGPIHYVDSLHLSPLLLTKKEIKTLAKFPGTKLLNQKASKQNFLESIGNQSVVHISSHGMASDQYGINYPWIAAFDQKIYLPELYNQNLNANLVTLSACETNLGEQVQGEGTISLTRGFFHAGAESVISSLWRVNEKSTAEILDNFYQLTNQGHNKAKALQMAKETYRANHPEYADAPYYWAGLIYYGQDVPINLPKAKAQWPLVLGIVLIVIFFGFLIFLRLKNISREDQASDL